MPLGRDDVARGWVPYARFSPSTYSAVPEGLVVAMARAQVGRNGWAVMLALCRMVYANGALGRASAGEIAARTGLTGYQVARGMHELRSKGLIVPVMHRTEDGRRVLDRSCHGHVAQYCVSQDIWALVALEGPPARE